MNPISSVCKKVTEKKKYENSRTSYKRSEMQVGKLTTVRQGNKNMRLKSVTKIHLLPLN